jgi:lysophospholipase L1-like esterase
MSLYRVTLHAAMTSQDVPYLQIAELTEDSALENGGLFGEHVHPSSSGHQLMAERLHDALRAGGMLEPLGQRDVADF